jgi:hypothetical protein
MASSQRKKGGSIVLGDNQGNGLKGNGSYEKKSFDKIMQSNSNLGAAAGTGT